MLNSDQKEKMAITVLTTMKYQRKRTLDDAANQPLVAFFGVLVVHGHFVRSEIIC